MFFLFVIDGSMERTTSGKVSGSSWICSCDVELGLVMAKSHTT